MTEAKSFHEIIKQRQKKTNAVELLVLPEQSKEISVISQKNKSLMVDFKEKVLSNDLQEIPALNVDLILFNDSIKKETREQLATIKDELVHGYKIVPRRRTDCEKRISVLQDNRFTTHGAKFFQANLEQQVHQQNLVGLTLDIEETNIELEKLLYEYKKLENKIDLIKSKQKNNQDKPAIVDNINEEAFAFNRELDEVFLLEKDLQLLLIKIRKKVIQLKEQKMNAENESLELLEWSRIKEEEFANAIAKNEAFNPEDPNYGQFINLAKRFFQNYLTAHATNSDATTSDVLNIDGLCLTALNTGIKYNLLDKMFEGFSEESIQFIWKGIYGIDVEFYTDSNGLKHMRPIQPK